METAEELEREKEIALRAEKLADELVSKVSKRSALAQISFWRGAYLHHAVLIDGKLIGEITAGAEAPTTAVEALLQKATAHFEIRDATPEELKTLIVVYVVPQSELQMASARLAAIAEMWKSGMYDLRSSNCEHVAHWIVTGLFESQQARLIRKAQNFVEKNPRGTAIAVVGVAAAAAAAIGAYWWSKQPSESIK
jgi:hypothetical protein